MSRQVSFKYGGFTLIESLLVLVVVSIFMILPILSIKGWQEDVNIEMGLSEFERNVQRVHQGAILFEKPTRVDTQLAKQQITYQYYQNGEKVVVVQHIAYPLELRGNGNFLFNGTTGNASKLSTIQLYDNKHEVKYKYKLQLGSGKVNKHVE
ncbi:MAG: competence type IV pilus minor pilin ComGD [Vagococcus sp.]